MTPPANGPARQRAVHDDGLERRGYSGYAQHARVTYEQNRRDREATHLRTQAREARERASEYAATALELHRVGDRAAAQQYHDAAVAWDKWAHERAVQAEAVLAGQHAPQRIDIDNDAEFQRINDDVGTLAQGAVETGNVSALTGTDHPPSVDATRPYGQRGGLRPPLALHQTDLERAMPRDADGNVLRTADPRQGHWFGLANDGGPAMDPTRGINCLDCSLSFYETWVHGRPRVSAPRTFEGYAAGDVDRPLDGEHDGPGRVEDITGGRFQQLSPDVRHLDPAAAQQAVYQGYTDLHNQLLAGGHGSYAFIVNNWEGGGSHAWVAINQNGTILYVDPQQGRMSENSPSYAHWGVPNKHNVVSIDALVLDGNGNPMPLDGRPQGMYSARPPITPSMPTPSASAVTTGPVTADAPVTATQSVTAMPPVTAATASPSVSPEPAPALLNEATYINRVHLLDAPTLAAAPAPAGAPPEGSGTGMSDLPVGPGDPQAGQSGVPGSQDTALGRESRDRVSRPGSAAQRLADLPRSELTGRTPLPRLGVDLAVERGDDGLIVAVEMGGGWVDIKEFVEILTEQRVELWRQLAANPDVPEVTNASIQPCVSVAVDRRTGMIAEGHNNMPVAYDDLHPLVRERIDAYMARCEAANESFEWESPYLHPSDPGQHSEIFSVSELLWQREAAGLPVGAESFSELRIDNHFPWRNKGAGKPAPCCANCTGIIPDVPCNAGKFPTFPPDPAQLWDE